MAKWIKVGEKPCIYCQTRKQAYNDRRGEGCSRCDYTGLSRDGVGFWAS